LENVVEEALDTEESDVKKDEERPPKISDEKMKMNSPACIFPKPNF